MEADTATRCIRLFSMFKRGIGLVAVTICLTLLTACGSTAGAAKRENFLKGLKADETVGKVFSDGKYDDTMVEFAEGLCEDFADGASLIDTAISGAETLGVSVEVSTALALRAATDYCPEVDVQP